MSIVANNCFRFNKTMDFWGLAGYTASDLMDSWNDIYSFALKESSSEDELFLEDCMDVLYEKVLSLPENDRIRIIDKASLDMETFEKKMKRGVA